MIEDCEWRLVLDGSFMSRGSWAGVILYVLNGIDVSLSFKLDLSSPMFLYHSN